MSVFGSFGGGNRGDKTALDPFGLNKNKHIGTMINPVAESFNQGSPAPMTDPIGSMFGLYNQDTKLGSTMNKIQDPIGVFKGAGGK